jgi:hypothetical protein
MSYFLLLDVASPEPAGTSGFAIALSLLILILLLISTIVGGVVLLVALRRRSGKNSGHVEAITDQPSSPNQL